MKLGIVITIYNRPEYLKRCFDSLLQADIPVGAQFVLIDDCSKAETMPLILGYSPRNANTMYVVNEKNIGVALSLKRGIEKCFAIGCDIVINLDADTIVKKDFIQALVKLKQEYQDNIVSGFNTLTKSKQGNTRHQIFAEGKGLVKKKSIGGINMVFDKILYEKYIQPTLNGSPHWDWQVCERCQKDNKLFIVSSPSVIQHIGFDSAMAHEDNPDVAEDFDIVAPAIEHEQVVYKNDREVNAEVSINVLPTQKETIILSQFQGIGDILFSMTIANDYIKEGYKIIWPVQKQFVALNKHFPEIIFIDMNLLNVNHANKTFQKVSGATVVPLRWADQVIKVHYKKVMRAKYDMLNKDWQRWRELTWVRDTEAENSLFTKLGLQEGEQYNLINRNFRSDASGKNNFVVNNGLKNIFMSEIEGYTLLDWGKIIENAAYIYTVSTSINYVIEVLNCKAKEIHLYPRLPDERDFTFIDYILTKEYVLHS